ncbi:hypothetical protein [Bremerella sp.]|uniref:hypothetical protein n=1 Tax=Bremerella sp. TaxID=2795602 RepID=UPI00391DE87B
MQLVISSTGTIHCLYDETLDLHTLGKLSISRGSHVEPNEAGLWYADLAPVGGPQLGPFGSRSAALIAEVRWLEEHWLSSSDH